MTQTTKKENKKMKKNTLISKLENKKHEVSVHEMNNNFFSVITKIKGRNSNIKLFSDLSSAMALMIHNFKRLETNT